MKCLKIAMIFLMSLVSFLFFFFIMCSVFIMMPLRILGFFVGLISPSAFTIFGYAAAVVIVPSYLLVLVLPIFISIKITGMIVFQEMTYYDAAMKAFSELAEYLPFWRGKSKA